MTAEASPEASAAEPAPPHLYAIVERSLDEITSQQPRVCDHCAQEQIYGCVAALVIGHQYLELCTACFAALHDGAMATKERLLSRIKKKK